MPNAIPGNAAIDLAAENAKETFARKPKQDKIQLLHRLVKSQRRGSEFKSPWK